MTLVIQESSTLSLVSEVETLALIRPDLSRLIDLSEQLLSTSLGDLPFLDVANKSEAKLVTSNFERQFAITGSEIIGLLTALPPVIVSEFEKTHRAAIKQIYQEQLSQLEDIFPHPHIGISNEIGQDTLLIFSSGKKGEYLPSQAKIEISMVLNKNPHALLKTITWWNGRFGVSIATWQWQDAPSLKDPIDLCLWGLHENSHGKLIGAKVYSGGAETSFTDIEQILVSLFPVQNHSDSKKV